MAPPDAAAPAGVASRIPATVAPQRRDERLELLGAELAPADRSLLLLRVELGMSWAEIAGALAKDGAHLGPVALRKRYQRLGGRLRELARAKGLVDA